MPILNILTNVPLNAAALLTSDLLDQVSKAVARILDKPEKSVMVLLKGGVPMLFAGTEDPAAYGELVSIGGLEPEKNKDLSAAVAMILETKLSIPKSRFYIKFQDIKQEPCSDGILCLHVLHQ